MTIIMTPVKLILKLFFLPVILVFTLISVLAKMLLSLGAYAVSPFMLFIFGCAVWTIYKHFWYQTGMLSVIELLTMTLYFGASTVIFALEEIRDRMIGFVWG